MVQKLKELCTRSLSTLLHKHATKVLVTSRISTRTHSD